MCARAVVVKKHNQMFPITLPTHTMYDGELLRLADRLKLPGFRGVRMLDELPKNPHNCECGILNFSTHEKSGTHWVGWYKSGTERYYFDSYGECPPFELVRYLKSHKEMIEGLPVIRQNALVVQHYQNECGSLCVYVLSELSRGVPFAEILTFLHQRFIHPKPLHVYPSNVRV